MAEEEYDYDVEPEEQEEEPKETKQPKKKAAKNKSEGAEIVQVPTQHEKAFQLEDGSVVGMDEFLVHLYNKIRKIERSVG